MKKSFWTSRILWVNVIALIALVVQLQTGFVVPVEYQAMALTFVNFILRLITKTELE